MVTGRLRQRCWETPEGDKRSVTEIEADEVGASLKWATAKVERSSQRGNGDRTQARERQAERGGDFNDAPALLSGSHSSALGSAGGAARCSSCDGRNHLSPLALTDVLFQAYPGLPTAGGLPRRSLSAWQRFRRMGHLG